ncbi:14-3-3 beta alpha-1 [Paramuricea clavata]|uniref:14-3-3 beta alpha-1 n=1 Tax=Paramuricea clavata TaxID=317549 RepID=A0A6S7GHC7_PARCT|nr:14-3-3 beta alpha-1 [Paramuricea clavata]
MDENITREDTITYAKMAEQAERYEDMVGYMENAVRAGGDLTADERNLLSVAYKNVVGVRRSAHRVVNSQISQLQQNDPKLAVATDFKLLIKAELDKRCRDVLDLLDNFLIKEVSEDDEAEPAIEQAVFYLKMKGDYFRYLVEVAEDDEAKKKVIGESSEAYGEASKIGKRLPSTNPIRLGLALNFSVFYYEIEDNPSKACELAKNAFDSAISELDNLKEESYKDSTLIMQLLRDNLTLWTSETNDDAPDVDDLKK